MRHAIPAVCRLQLEAEVARRVRARNADARRSADAGVRRAQFADHCVGDVVDVLVRAGVLEQRTIPLVDRRPILAVHLRIVVAVLHHAVRLVEELSPLVATIDAHVEGERHGFARARGILRRPGLHGASTTGAAARGLPGADRQPLDREADLGARTATPWRIRRTILTSRRAHLSAEVHRAPVRGRLHTGERARRDATTITSVDRDGVESVLRVVAGGAASTAPSPAAAESTAAHRVVNGATVARQEVRTDARRPARELRDTAVDSFHVYGRRPAAGRRAVAATSPAAAGCSAIALAHERVVRIFAEPRQRYGEELILSAVAVRREDQ